MSLRFLVIGGAGYIGSHFVRESIRQGHQVVVYDNLCRGHRESIPSEVAFIQGDLLDKSALKAAFEFHKFDAVFHFAAYALVGESVQEPEIYYENNVEGVRALLDIMRTLPLIPVLVFSSSCAVFGTPEKLPIAEGDRKAPQSPYGKTKLIDEWMIEDYCHAHGIRAIALRYFNACGADSSGEIGEAHEPETHLIPNILKAVLNESKVTIHGQDFATVDGTCVRDYVHVLDLADAHIKAAQYALKLSEGSFDAIHLGTGHGYSNLEILRAAEQVVGKTIPYEFGPRRAGDPAKLYADTHKARELLGFHLKHSDLRSILESAWKWHQSHPKGYRLISRK